MPVPHPIRTRVETPVDAESDESPRLPTSGSGGDHRTVDAGRTAHAGRTADTGRTAEADRPDTAFGDFNELSDFGRPGDLTRTPAADLFFGDFAPPLDPDLIFECSASMNGEHGGVALYEDRVIVESPDEPDGEAVFSADTVRSWWIVEGPSFFALVVEADVLHRTRLPGGFRAVLVSAFAKAFGPAATPSDA